MKNYYIHVFIKNKVLFSTLPEELREEAEKSEYIYKNCICPVDGIGLRCHNKQTTLIFNNLINGTHESIHTTCLRLHNFVRDFNTLIQKITVFWSRKRVYQLSITNISGTRTNY